jgi:hypothetical protein
MAWVAVGIVATSAVTSLAAGNQAKKGSDKEAQLDREAGQVKKQASELEANVLETQATQRVAAAQRDMIDIQRMTKLTQSRAQALSAFSGGGASAPTVLTIMGNIAKEGAYNGARALYEGEESARIMRLQAFEKRQEGQFAEVSGNLQAEAATSRGRAAELTGFSNALAAGGSLYGKYGGRGPSSSTSKGYFSLDV